PGATHTHPPPQADLRRGVGYSWDLDVGPWETRLVVESVGRRASEARSPTRATVPTGRLRRTLSPPVAVAVRAAFAVRTGASARLRLPAVAPVHQPAALLPCARPRH